MPTLLFGSFCAVEAQDFNLSIGRADGMKVSATASVVTAVEGVYQSVMLRSEPGKNAASATTFGTFPAFDKVFKPSSKAMQSDEQAANPDILDGYTKSVAAIHGAYEQLDEQLYPYQPYYQFPDYYVMHGRRTRTAFDHDFSQIMNQAFLAAGTSSKVSLLSLRRVVVPKHREGYTFYDEPLRNAYSALFVSDPMSRDAFDCLVRTLVLDDLRACPVEFPMDNPEQGIISEDDNLVLAFNSFDDFLKMRANRRDQALALARSITPIDVVRTAIEQWIDAIPAAPRAVERYMLYWLANEAYEEVLTQHDEYVAGDVPNSALGAKLNACRETYPDIIEAGKKERIELRKSE